MECLGRYTFFVMTSVILSGGMKMRVEHGMLREVYIFIMTSVILSGGMKMRVGHGMLREVYSSCHYFCHTFRSSMECLGGVYICTFFLLCRFIYRFICSLPGSTFICRLICSLQTVAMPHPLRTEPIFDLNYMNFQGPPFAHRNLFLT